MLDPFICAQCNRELYLGRGTFFEVRISAVADPYSPDLDVSLDARREWEQLMKSLHAVSEQEAKDSVHREITLQLCNACFRIWIENPTSYPTGSDQPKN